MAATKRQGWGRGSQTTSKTTLQVTSRIFVGVAATALFVCASSVGMTTAALAAPAPLRWGLESGDHLSGNHLRPGPGSSRGGGDHQRGSSGDAPWLKQWQPGSRRGPHHPPGGGAHRGDFVERAGARLKLHRDEFRFAGTNNYYLPYKSELMVDDVLVRAADQGFSVVRTWGFIDIGNQDGTNSTRGKADGVVYFHYFDGANPAFNDGPDGLQHLDYVIKKAGELGLRLVIPLTNNWGDFGGMDQYVRWAGGQFHDDFYTDSRIRGWFKDWISHVLNHRNSYTGVRYKDDPTIMTIELGNEPRCGGGGLYPRSAGCTAATLTTWAAEMSSFIKKLDRNHLVSVGDEGFYCDPSASNWIDQCGDGVDSLALTALPHVDVMSFHLYPDGWGQSTAWATEWINRHFADALALRKPAMLGEFGFLDKGTRNPVYKEWTDTAFQVGGAGALYWLLSGVQDDGTLYPDYDGFTVYCPSGVCETLSNFAAQMSADQALPLAPVADDDGTETTTVTPKTVSILANDVTYGGVILAAASVDLDPMATGQQTVSASGAGTFTANLDGTVTFVATAGFTGSARASYLVADALGRLSNAALITVLVKPEPSATQLLFSFENAEGGATGWSALNGAANGTVEQSADFASQGSFSAKITPSTPGNSGDWFGTVYASSVDLTGKTHVSWEIKTTDSGTSQELAFQSGDGWVWCQTGDFAWVNGATTTTVQVDLNALTCFGGVADLANIHTTYIYLGNGGTSPIYLDNIRAE